MLPSIKNDLMYLLNILESIEKIMLYSADCSDAESFYQVNEQMNFNATLNLLANLGENTSKLSDELKNIYSDIDWSQIKGFRNRVVHDYINVDTFMVFDIIKNNLKPLKSISSLEKRFGADEAQKQQMFHKVHLKLLALLAQEWLVPEFTGTIGEKTDKGSLIESINPQFEVGYLKPTLFEAISAANTGKAVTVGPDSNRN